MTGSPGVIDYFAIEAGEYVSRLDALLANAERAPDADALLRETRALRGSATMARHAPLTALAAAIEAAAAAVRDGRRAWTPQTADALIAAVDAFKALLRRVREWGPQDDALANERVLELRGLAAGEVQSTRGAAVVPIATLFYDDAGPHIVHQNPRPPVTADLRFRQAAVPLASTLRRLVAEGRHATDEAARHAAGSDLRAALRDLGELAESYHITAVVNFAHARDEGLAQLDERTLDVVDAAAQALIDSAGTVWTRSTPPAPARAVPPASIEAARTAPNEPPEAAVPNEKAREIAPRVEAPPSSAPAAAAPSSTPPSGQALVQLLETSISGLRGVVDDAALAAPSSPESPPVGEAERDTVVDIDALLYRGRSALDRAREVRNALRAAAVRGAARPDPALLAELFDLLDLAADDELARA